MRKNIFAKGVSNLFDYTEEDYAQDLNEVVNVIDAEVNIEE